MGPSSNQFGKRLALGIYFFSECDFVKGLSPNNLTASETGQSFTVAQAAFFMTKAQPHIPSDLVTVTAAAKILTQHGDKITPQGLTKYVHRHGLIEQQLGRSLLVNPARLADHRDNFSREVMSGQHLKENGTRPASKTSPTKSRAKSKSNKPALTLATTTDTPADNVASLDRSRIAKAEKEEAQADKARLDLYKQTRDLISTAEFETLLGLLMTLLKESFFGVNLSDDTDAILSVNNLPDARKKPTQNILKARRKETLTAFAQAADREMARLDPDHASGYAARFKKIIADIHTLRESQFSDMLGGATDVIAPHNGSGAAP